MRSFGAFLTLIRWPNLVFIALTQLLFYFLVSPLAMTDGRQNGNDLSFYLLVLASVLISAAGYIINDYFDVQIDAINKPDRLIVGKKIKRRWAIVWHLVLSGIGFALSVYVSFACGSPVIALVNFGCIILLWVYSISLKRSLLLGNISIAFLTVWVFVVIYFFVSSKLNTSSVAITAHFFKYTILYASFAFIVTLIREVVKDIEDIEGDREYQSSTLPITWGVPAAKIFTAVWIVVCIGMLVVVVLYAFQLQLWYISLYALCVLILPLSWLLISLYKARIPADYHKMSIVIKLIMLSGILSMIFFLTKDFTT